MPVVGDPRLVFKGYQAFGGHVPSGQVDIRSMPDEILEIMLDLQARNQRLVKAMALMGIPSQPEHIQECIDMIRELDVPYKDPMIDRLKKTSTLSNEERALLT